MRHTRQEVSALCTSAVNGTTNVDSCVTFKEVGQRGTHFITSAQFWHRPYATTSDFPYRSDLKMRFNRSKLIVTNRGLAGDYSTGRT